MIADLVLALSLLCPAVPRAELRQDARALVEAALAYELPPALLAAVMVRESTCRRAAENPRTRAGGLMGVLRRTPGETFAENIRAAARLLAEYGRRCGGREATLSAYNRGPGGGRNCRATAYSAAVLELEAWIVFAFLWPV